MTAPFWSLVRFVVVSTYAPSRRGARRALGSKRSPKALAKAIGIGALALLVVGDLGTVFAMMNLTMYKALKPAGLQGLLLLNASIMGALLVFVVGFLTALSTYCASKADTSLLALPIEGRSLLGAKMIMVYLADFALAFFFIAIAAIVYAVMEAPPAAFYVGALLTALAAPLVPIAAIYLIVVPLMIAARPLRSKNAVMLIGGLVGIAFSLAFNVYVQSANQHFGDGAWILKNFAGPDAVLARAGAAYPPAILAWKSMAAGGFAGLLCALANLALGLGAAALVALALGRAYAKSLLGFEEQRVKRVVPTDAYIAKSFRRRAPLLALFRREVRLMNREPVYFLNGPFVIILMPLIMAVGVVVVSQNKNAMAAIGQLKGAFTAGPWAMLASAAFGAFLGSSTSIASTALSRDAKALPYLKALPMGYRDFMLAKFLHGFAFAVFGAVAGGAGCALIFGLSPLEAAGAFLVALAFSAFACIAGLWLDTANPRLSWDNPIAALKQNPNASISMLGVMGIIAALGAASAFLPLGKLAFFALYFGLFSAAAASLLRAYPKFAERKLRSMEA
jgi:ABC-2 type transport system permease protein